MPGSLNHDQKHRSATAGYAGDKVRAMYAAHIADGCSPLGARLLTASAYGLKTERVRELVEAVK